MLKPAFKLMMPFVAAALCCGAGFSNRAENDEVKVKWLTFEEAWQLNKKAPRKFFIDVYTDWCGWCREMDRVTFSNPVIADYLNKNYYPIKFNAETSETIRFKEKEFVFLGEGNRGVNQLATELMEGRMSYPTVVFLNEKADMIQPIPGFRGAEEMDRILKYFGGNYHKSVDYQTFSNTYESPVKTSPQGY